MQEEILHPETGAGEEIALTQEENKPEIVGEEIIEDELH